SARDRKADCRCPRSSARQRHRASRSEAREYQDEARWLGGGAGFGAGEVGRGRRTDFSGAKNGLLKTNGSSQSVNGEAAHRTIMIRATPASAPFPSPPWLATPIRR